MIDAPSAGEKDVSHVLYKTGDMDAPDVIKDRNGEVVLDLCRVCNKGEIELSQPCSPHPTNDDKLEVVAHAYVVNGDLEQIDWGDDYDLPDDTSLVKLVRQSDATRIITELAERIAELHGRLMAEGEAVTFYRAASVSNRRRAEAAEAREAQCRALNNEWSRRYGALYEDAEKRAAINAELIKALESFPSDTDFANAEGFRQAVNSWWNITARTKIKEAKG